MQDGLAVALGFEGALAQNRPQVGVVVDLAVGHEHVFVVGDGLGSVLGSNNRETAMGHHDGRIRCSTHAHVVGTAMGDPVDHPMREIEVVDLPKADIAAHA